MMKRMPTLFVGHGSPMMALEHTETTSTFQAIGKKHNQQLRQTKSYLSDFCSLVYRWHLYSKRREPKTNLRYVWIPSRALRSGVSRKG